jgi:SAM-dependent methyltransferase
MQAPVTLVCPTHAEDLEPAGAELRCPRGCAFPVVGGIARFVRDEGYAGSFGLQWRTFRRTQLDSHTGTTISRERLERIAGGSLEGFRGRTVLEVGCGAGRFTEIMLEAGARVFAVDLSSAVEANYENCRERPGYFVCQADVARLPTPREQFDIVVCVGVIQHTPDPEATMAALCAQVKPGGLLLIDHYSPGYPATLPRRLLRSFLLGRPAAFSMAFCDRLVAALWPIHRALWSALGEHKRRRGPMRILRSLFLRLSPVVDYHDAYPQLGPAGLRVWALLDTHDTVTDAYKHLRSEEQIATHLARCGMTDIVTQRAGNGVEARARKR